MYAFSLETVMLLDGFAAIMCSEMESLSTIWKQMNTLQQHNHSIGTCPPSRHSHKERNAVLSHPSFSFSSQAELIK